MSQVWGSRASGAPPAYRACGVARGAAAALQLSPLWLEWGACGHPRFSGAIESPAACRASRAHRSGLVDHHLRFYQSFGASQSGYLSPDAPISLYTLDRCISGKNSFQESSLQAVLSGFKP